MYSDEFRFESKYARHEESARKLLLERELATVEQLALMDQYYV